MLKISPTSSKQSMEIEDVEWIGVSSNLKGDIFLITVEGIIIVEKSVINDKTFKYVSCDENKCYETTDVAWKLFELLCELIE